MQFEEEFLKVADNDYIDDKGRHLITIAQALRISNKVFENKYKNLRNRFEDFYVGSTFKSGDVHKIEETIRKIILIAMELD